MPDDLNMLRQRAVRLAHKAGTTTARTNTLRRLNRQQLLWLIRKLHSQANASRPTS